VTFFIDIFDILNVLKTHLKIQEHITSELLGLAACNSGYTKKKKQLALLFFDLMCHDCLKSKFEQKVKSKIPLFP
jgi:hypothetical protein